MEIELSDKQLKDIHGGCQTVTLTETVPTVCTVSAPPPVVVGVPVGGCPVGVPVDGCPVGVPVVGLGGGNHLLNLGLGLGLTVL